MATEKIVNYTAEQTAELVAAYTADPTKATIETLATKLGKSVRSIVAKLAREGVYKSEAKETAGKRALTKAEIVARIAAVIGKTEEQLESLEKATAPALNAVLFALETNGTQEAVEVATE